jgi:hypothetical protein
MLAPHRNRKIIGESNGLTAGRIGYGAAVSGKVNPIDD